MKQIIFLILFMLSGCLCVNAQSGRYSAFSVSGKVQVKQDSDWKDVTKRMPLGAFDELNIPANGSIKILENKTNSIYKNSSTGVITVRQLVKEANSKSESSLSSLTQAFTKGMSTKLDNDNRLRSVGAAHRGANSNISFEDSICSTIAYTATQILSSGLQLQDSAVIGSKIVEDDTYVLSLENISDLAYCVNIVSVNSKTKKCRLLLSPGYDENQPYFILDSNTKVVLDGITYLIDPEERLFLLASDRLFDNEEVKAMLEDCQLCDGENMFEMQYFEIK